MTALVNVRINCPRSDAIDLARGLHQFASGEVQTKVTQGRAVIEFSTADPDAVANDPRLVLTQDVTFTVVGP